jgi:hypothetical protein
MPLFLRDVVVGHLADVGLGDGQSRRVKDGVCPDGIETCKDQRIVIIYADLLDPPLLVGVCFGGLCNEGDRFLEGDLGGVYR